MTKKTTIRAIEPDDMQDTQVSTPLEENEKTPVYSDKLAEMSEYDEAWDYEKPSLMRRGWLVPSLAACAVLGWTGFYGWAHQTDILSGGTPQLWADWIIAWSVPVLLIVSIWMLATRGSRTEAKRFNRIARSLSDESILLEDRLTTVNRELSLAREFLSAQSLELDSVGRLASERIAQHAERLQSLVISNADQIDSIADVSTKALDNMDRLRDDLPVIANSARDVSNQIGTAGQTAHNQTAQLTDALEKLSAFSKTSQGHVEAIGHKIDGVIGEFEQRTEQVEQLSATRFTALREASEALRSDLDSREVDILAALRRRADALAEEFSSSRTALEEEEEEALRSLKTRLMAIKDEAVTVSSAVQDSEDKALTLWQTRIATLKQQLIEAIGEIERIDKQALDTANIKLQSLREEAEIVDANLLERNLQLTTQLSSRREQLAQDEEEALTKLTEQLAAFDRKITAHRVAQSEAANTLAERSEAIASRIDGLRLSIEEITTIGDGAVSSLTSGAEALDDQLTLGQHTLAATHTAVGELTEATVRLLELIQASAQHSTNDLPAALTVAEDRLNDVRQQAGDLRTIIDEAESKSRALSANVISASEKGQDSIAAVGTMRDSIKAANALTEKSIADIAGNLADLNQQSDLLSEKAQHQLRSAILALEEAAINAPANIETGVRDSLLALVANIGQDTGEVLERTLNESAKESIARLEEASRQAATNGHNTAIQLRDQLSKVNELAGNLETRVARAREQAEEQTGNEFARRMALITESLNSSSIDIAKAFDADVTDTAWTSYLRGDRGIFTRRAVRLIGNTEARDIAEIYDEDANFRENVSRYIHDFEAMLRSILSTRDGNVLSVTLLSSDMGKLYVVLAQAIQRLRE